MRVLIATDGTDVSFAALAAGEAIFALGKAEVFVVTVASLPGRFAPSYPLAAPGLVSIATPDDERAVETAAHQALDGARRYLEDHGIAATYVYAVGDPAQEVLRAAEQIQPDLVIVGSHGRGPLGRLILGSVSEAVLHRWHGAILVAHQPARQLSRRQAGKTEDNMRTIKDVMTPNPLCVTSDANLQEAARLMVEADAGILPVLDGDTLKGVITDRDIIVRAIAKGIDPKTGLVRDALTTDVDTIGPDMSIQDAVEHMENRQIRRLVVCENDKVVGVVSLGDLAECESQAAEGVLVEVSKSPKTLAHGHGG